jgi:hypothetical protein
MDFPPSDFGSGPFNAKPNGDVAALPMRNPSKDKPSREDRRKPSRKQTSDSDYSSLSTDALKIGNSHGSDRRHKRKRGNAIIDEDTLSSKSTKSSDGANELNDPSFLDSAKRRRVDELSTLQGYLDAQNALQGKSRDAGLSELSSRAITSRLLGEAGNAFSPLAASSSANFFVPSAQQANLSTSLQLSDLLRNCGLGAAVASLSNQGPLRFDGSLTSSFLRQQRLVYTYQAAISGMPSAADYLNAYAAPASLLPQQAGVPDAGLTATWLRLLDASGSMVTSPYAAQLEGATIAPVNRPTNRLDSLPSNYSAVSGVRGNANERGATTRHSRAEEGNSCDGRVVHDAVTKHPAVTVRRVSPTLPPCDEGEVRHYSERAHLPLATDEDQNWLSEFLCFVRAELVEVFRASREDVASRLNSKKVAFSQVGIRCRYCAHLPHNSRASRSSSFPSSVGRIYQSLTMMLREHFGNCKAVPQELRNRFLELKSKTSQGATNSKRYWVHSAMKLGMLDSANGIWVTEKSQAAAMTASPFGTPDDNIVAGHSARADSESTVLMVSPSDRDLVTGFLYTLMTQVQRVYLTESERVGSRKNLPIGLPGIGCRHCCPSNRRGLCRFFPARRRTLPNKLNDLYNHIRRCTLCPGEVKAHLAALELEAEQNNSKDSKDSEGERAFFDQIWTRLGH